jgi:hypothetical protein
MCKMKLIPVIAAFIVLSASILVQAEDYYVLAYGPPNNYEGRRGIYLKMIDLDSAKIKDSLLVANGGMVPDGHPISLTLMDKYYCWHSWLMVLRIEIQYLIIPKLVIR